MVVDAMIAVLFPLILTALCKLHLLHDSFIELFTNTSFSVRGARTPFRRSGRDGLCFLLREHSPLLRSRVHVAGGHWTHLVRLLQYVLSLTIRSSSVAHLRRSPRFVRFPTPTAGNQQVSWLELVSHCQSICATHGACYDRDYVHRTLGHFRHGVERYRDQGSPLD